MLDTEAKDEHHPPDHKTPDEIPSEDDNVTNPETVSENSPEDVPRNITPDTPETYHPIESSPEDLSRNVPPDTPENFHPIGNLSEDVREGYTPHTPESIRILSRSPDPHLWLEELEQKVDCDLQSLIYNNEAGIPYQIPFIDAAVLEKVFSWEFQNDLDAFLSNGEDSLHIATAQLIHYASGGDYLKEWCGFSERDVDSLNGNVDDKAHSNTTSET